MSLGAMSNALKSVVAALVVPLDVPLDVPPAALLVFGVLEVCVAPFDDEHAATHNAAARQPESSSPLVMSLFLRSRCVRTRS
jgi:hypothetical protein